MLFIGILTTMSQLVTQFPLYLVILGEICRNIPFDLRDGTKRSHQQQDKVKKRRAGGERHVKPAHLLSRSRPSLLHHYCPQRACLNLRASRRARAAGKQTP